MRSTFPPDPQSARVLSDYAHLYGLASASNLGLSGRNQVDMTVDGIYRLRLHALPQGGVVIHSRLCTLPEPGMARDDLLLGTARLACGTLREHTTTCVVDDRERALWLQQTCSANSTQDIDDAVGCFVNSLAFWSKAISAV